jgi:hypothetical protein
MTGRGRARVGGGERVGGRGFRVTADDADETILRGVQRNARRVLMGRAPTSSTPCSGSFP